MNPAQPPEGILDPQQPYWPADRVGEVTWLRLKGKLTGRPVPGLSENFTSYVKLGDADADRLIANIKKYGKYPQVNQNDKYGGAYNNEAYQKWLVEEFLEKPFREEVNEKIDARTEQVLNRVFPEAQEEIKEAETKSEVAAVIEDKVEVLEAIKEDMNPPRSEYQIPDPWEGSYTSGAPQATVKKTKKRGRPKGSTNKTKKKKKKTSAGNPPPPPPKKSFSSKFGGGVKGVAKAIGRKTLNFMEGATPQGEAQGPSVLGVGAWLGKKVAAAFQDAKKEKERALEAEANGAELPPEVKEKGYFLKKSLGYQFGGQVLDQTVGTFFENIPSKQSSKKAGFGDKFDYGDGDPKNKKQQSDIKDLATGFRKVTNSLRAINKSTNELIQMMSKLVGETSRVADTLEAIQNSIAGLIDVEINTDDSQDTPVAGGGDINIGDINIGDIGKEGGLNLLDILGGVDDALDIAKLTRKGKKGLGKQNPLYRTARRRGMPNMKMPRAGGMGKFGMLKNVIGAGRAMLSEGTAPVASPVRAMIGEAGPEIVTGSPRKFAEGAIMQGTGSNVLATGLGAAGNLMKKVQPFANVMEMPFKVIGAQISGALSALVSAAGPFSGVIAKMFSPILGGLATIFGLNQGAFAAEINSSAMTEEQGSKELGRFFANFFRWLGITIGKPLQSNEQIPPGGGYVPIDWKQDPAFGEAVNKVAQHFNISASDLMGLMASESGLRPDADNGSHTGLIQMSDTSAAAAGTTRAALKKMSRAEQMPYVQKYLENAKLPQGASAGQLYTAVFLPAFVGKPDNFVVASQDGSEPAGYESESPKWYRGNAGLDGNGDGKITIQELGGRIQKKKKEFGIPASKGTTQTITSSFSDQIKGVFEISGPDTGYKVPTEYTGGVPVIGHGIEYLINVGSKFVILPVQNKEYDVYRDPAKAFNRYEQIGQQGGMEVAGLIDTMDRLIFGSQKTGKPVAYPSSPPKRRYYAADEDGAEILRLLGGTQVKGASLPEANVVPLAIPKDTVTGTNGSIVAMVKPVIQYVPVAVPGPERVEYVPASTLAAAVAMENLLHSRALG